MKNKQWIIAVFSIATVVTGCNQSNPSNESPAVGDRDSLSATQQLENAREAATNAWQKTKEVTTNVMATVREGTTNAWADIKESLQAITGYAYDRKDAFVADATADMDATDKKLKELLDKVANANDSVKANARAKLQDLDAKRAELGKKLDEVKNSTEADWSNVKTGFKSTYDDLQASIKQTWDSL